MKAAAFLFITFLASSALADIQDPPSNDYGPTRKLSRGLSNLVFGCTEIPVTIAKINEDEGNSAAVSYGAVRGVGRMVSREFAGLFEILLFPVPAWRQSYAPMLPSDVRYIHAGYSEFPPELGNETKYPYARTY